MNLLAIDTSIGTSVALQIGETICETLSSDERGHAEAIGGLIAQTFSDTGASPGSVEGVVVGIGPGPFTGLRVGIAAAKAFATGLGVPLLPLSGHEAVAYQTLLANEEAGVVRVLQDARRRELFVTEYEGLDRIGAPHRIVPPHLLARTDYVEESRDVWPSHIPASALLQLAQLRLQAGREFDVDRALYLRAPDVKPAAAVKRVSV